jgi:hypothetical protein
MGVSIKFQGSSNFPDFMNYFSIGKCRGIDPRSSEPGPRPRLMGIWHSSSIPVVAFNLGA